MSLAAIVGGTASKLGGGKFANGAVSGAFVHMYNYTAHVPNWLPKEGNRAEQQNPVLKGINMTARGIYKFFDVIGTAFGGLYKGMTSMDQRIQTIKNPKARMVATVITVKAMGGTGGILGGPLLDMAQAGDVIETNY